MIFPGDFTKIARLIREEYPFCTYDHRPSLPMGVDSLFHTEQFRLGYACFKRTVAWVIKPESIVEIGVGLGISALAFLDGYPTATYTGIDNDCESDRDFPIKPSQFVGSMLGTRGKVLIKDSTKMDRIPQADLVHVDGGHSYEDAYNDVLLAWRSNARWILVDDARDSVVASATFDALKRKSPGSVDWAYFENTWTGNILISRVKERP